MSGFRAPRSFAGVPRIDLLANEKGDFILKFIASGKGRQRRLDNANLITKVSLALVAGGVHRLTIHLTAPAGGQTPQVSIDSASLEVLEEVMQRLGVALSSGSGELIDMEHELSQARTRFDERGTPGEQSTVSASPETERMTTAPVLPPILLTIPQAAEALSVGRATIYRYINAGKLPAVVMGLGGKPLMRVRYADCQKFANRMATAKALR